MNNLKIKEFDQNLGTLINGAIENGVDISTVVICLDKWSFSARDYEKSVIQAEQNEMDSRQKAEQDAALKEQYNEFMNSEPGDTNDRVVDNNDIDELEALEEELTEAFAEDEPVPGYELLTKK